jgi:hypothetical protein
LGNGKADTYRALKAPGWKKEWHVGVRATGSGKLLAFISGIPLALRVRQKTLNCSEVNFLCVHKKLRAKRLTPVLIKEITRRCYVEGTFQAVYTVGSLLPTPVSTCRYFHRAIDWEKLYDVGFSPLARMDLAQVFTKEEFIHWMAPTEKPKEQVVWTYVVEDPQTKKITDFFSFYNLESTVIGNKKHSVVKAAYLFYYATEVAFEKDDAKLKTRLNSLMKDALILSKKVSMRNLDCISVKMTNVTRLASTSSTPSHSSTTRSSSKNKNSAPATVRCTTTSTTTARRPSPAALMRGTNRVRNTWVGLGWSCCSEIGAEWHDMM